MIKKNELEERMRKVYEREMVQLEEKIDGLLLACDFPVRVPVDEFSRVAIEAVKEKYEKEGGYTVVRSFGNQRDPCNDLVFS